MTKKRTVLVPLHCCGCGHTFQRPTHHQGRRCTRNGCRGYLSSDTHRHHHRDRQEAQP